MTKTNPTAHALRLAIIQTLKEYNRPVNSKSIWYRVIKTIPEVPIKKVQDQLYILAIGGQLARSRESGQLLYTLTPEHANGTPIPVPHPKPKRVPVVPVEAAPVVPVTVQAEPVKALQVGQYTINPSGWTVADDHGPMIELFIKALELDPATKHAHSKRLKFDGNERIIVKMWLAGQAGTLMPPVDVSALERDRDAAQALAEEAEQRAKAAEARAEAAELAISQIRKTLGLQEDV